MDGENYGELEVTRRAKKIFGSLGVLALGILILATAYTSNFLEKGSLVAIGTISGFSWFGNLVNTLTKDEPDEM